jgi:hypothetical protein
MFFTLRAPAQKASIAGHQDTLFLTNVGYLGFVAHGAQTHLDRRRHLNAPLA